MSRYTTVFPRYNNGVPTIANWNEFYRAVERLADKTTLTPQLAYYASYSTLAFKWVGAITGHLGDILFCPLNAASMLRFMPSTNTWATIATPAVRRGWFGCAVAPNGWAYFIPNYGSHVIRINTNQISDGVSAIGPDYGSAVDFKWQSATVASNGNIYAPPRQMNGILKITTSTDTVSTFGTVSATGAIKYLTSHLLPDGKIYCFGNQDQALYMVIDPSNDTFLEIAKPADFTPGTNGLGIDGKIYFLPLRTDTDRRITVFDYRDHSFTKWHTVGAVDDSWANVAKLGPDGRTYFFPNNARYMIAIDPMSDTIDETVIDFGADLQKYNGGAFTFDGRLVCSPSHVTSIAVVFPAVPEPNNIADKDFYLNYHWNRS